MNFERVKLQRPIKQKGNEEREKEEKREGTLGRLWK